LKKTTHGFLNVAMRKNAVFDVCHFRWLAAIEDVGTSLCQSQLAEKLRFATNR
jgi:hypothetical protein